MDFSSKLIVGLLIVELAYLCGFFSPVLPSLDPGEGWWAKNNKTTSTKDDVKITPFRISFDKKKLQDLKGRLRETRFFESFEDTNWSYGARADQMKSIRDYWLNKYR